ncbi:MAG: putative metallopeptidase [Nitrososphaerota archaeon]|nr:putative metallopeptidase [Candidatus Bathyarchaeota archaeon]MDW8048315.1 putative metallopeptidase [Nitrososphaerota archaeon]
MTIRYRDAPDVKMLVNEIIESLGFFHIVPQFVHCVRSTGSNSTRTIARIHGLGRLWQEVLNCPPAYVIEVISERFDNLSQDEKEKTLIHELLHIPKNFTGGFRPHKGYISRKTIEVLHKRLENKRADKILDHNE